MEPEAHGGLKQSRIEQLPEDVINRVAAGEVIQRPSSALKELVENAIDAGATAVSVTVREGGNKLLQVQDDGEGVSPEDLPNLCKRHATSKIRRFEEVQVAGTFGFRGEALASMSFAGKVSVTTMQRGQSHALRASYRDGEMEGEPRPCAGVPGTIIAVEDIFATMPARKRALRSSAEEHSRCLSVLQCYAVLHPQVSFTCKRKGRTAADMALQPAQSRRDRIQAVYGQWLLGAMTSSDVEYEDGMRLEAYFSDGSAEPKKSSFTVCVNGRPVMNGSLRRAAEEGYRQALPKKCKPFVFALLSVPCEEVDPNVHPAKEEVHLLRNDAAVDRLQSAIESELLSRNSSRSFRASGTPAPAVQGIQQSQMTAQYEHHMDRTDPHSRTLEAFFSPHSEANPDQAKPSASTPAMQFQEPELASVKELLAEVERERHDGLAEILGRHTLVGMADGTFALVQHRTELYLVSVPSLSWHLMRQQAIRGVGQLRRADLSQPLPLRETIRIALESAESKGERDPTTDGPTDEVTERFAECLERRRELLDECFSVRVSEDGELTGLPVLLEQHAPSAKAIPELLLSIACDTDWTGERACFSSIASCLADCYALTPLEAADCRNALAVLGDGHHVPSNAAGKEDRAHWQLAHVVFPAIRLFLVPARSLASDGSVVQVASLEHLYRIFERC